MSERNCDRTIDKWPAEKRTGIDPKSIKASSISQSTTENSIREQFTLKPTCKFEKEKTKIINYLDVDVGKILDDENILFFISRNVGLKIQRNSLIFILFYFKSFSHPSI